MIYKQDFALNNQWLICYKNKPTQLCSKSHQQGQFVLNVLVLFYWLMS